MGAPFVGILIKTSLGILVVDSVSENISALLVCKAQLQDLSFSR